MKKSLILILTFAITMLSACGVQITQTDLDEAQDVVARYMDDTVDNSLDSIEKYFVVNTDNRKEYNSYTTRIEEKLDGNLKGISEIKQFFGNKVINGLYDKITTAILGKIQYEINSVEVDAKKKKRIVVKCSVDFPVMGSTSENSEEYINMLSDYIDISDSEKMMETILERSGMTIEELSEYYADMTQEEITKDMLSYYSEEIDAYLSAIIDKMVENVSYENIEKTMYMTKQSNDSWKILRVE